MRGPLLSRLSAVLAALLLLLGLAVTAAYLQLRRSMQPRDGDASVAGLAGRVVVAFDSLAIPSIFASSEADLFRAQGYVHAGERLWQMEMYQRLAQGRLAEVLGEAALETDRLVRTLDLWGIAARSLAALPPPERDALEAYAAGVNARIDAWSGPWPPEFLILGIEPQPWSPQASLAIGKIMALDLSTWRTELARARMAARVPEEKRRVLEPWYPAWGPTILEGPGAGAAAGSARRPTASGRSRTVAGPEPAAPGPERTRAGRTIRSGPDGPGRGTPAGAVPAGSRSRRADPFALLASLSLSASNGWALAGERTADGYPIVASDMHLSLRAPSTWYLNALHAEETGFGVAGLSIPGAPGVVVGYNRSLAWSFTNAMVDDADFVVETPTLDGSAYRAGGEWVPFETREERIAVRGRDEPVIHGVRETVRGPIITDVVSGGGLTLSLLWATRRPAAEAVGLLRMNRARSADEFAEGVAALRSPHQNVIYGTTSGTIGYRMSGSVPRRDGIDGAWPVPHEEIGTGWPGVWPADSMPRARDPVSGFLASANNLQSRDLFGRVGVDYPIPFRAARIVDVLGRRSGWTLEAVRRLQRDVYSVWADRRVQRAVRAARRIGEGEVAGRLGAWDRRVSTDSPEALLFFTWLFALRDRIAVDELGEDGWFPDAALERVLEEGGGPWADDVRTPAVETLEALEENAMRTAIEAAGGRTWGEAHRERSAHVLGAVRWLDRAFRFDVGPYPGPGGPHTVRPDDPHRWAPLDGSAWSFPAYSEYGPSERFVARLVPGRPTGWFLLPTGQAGNPLDPHYRDMRPRWAGSELVELPLSRASVEARTVARSRLSPPPEEEDAETPRGADGVPGEPGEEDRNRVDGVR